MRIKSRLILSLPLLAGGALLQSQGFAQEQFEDSIPIELATFFSDGASFYRTLPPDFPDIRLPLGLEVIGAMDKDERQQVLFRSQLGADEAERALAESLASAGWRLQSDAEGAGEDFPGPDAPVALCHEELGMVWLNGRDGTENRVYLRRTQPGGEQDFSCDDGRRLFSFE